MSKSLDIFRHFKKEIKCFNKSGLEENFIKEFIKEFIKDLGEKWFGFSKMERKK